MTSHRIIIPTNPHIEVPFFPFCRVAGRGGARLSYLVRFWDLRRGGRHVACNVLTDMCGYFWHAAYGVFLLGLNYRGFKIRYMLCTGDDFFLL